MKRRTMSAPDRGEIPLSRRPMGKGSNSNISHDGNIFLSETRIRRERSSRKSSKNRSMLWCRGKCVVSIVLLFALLPSVCNGERSSSPLLGPFANSVMENLASKPKARHSRPGTRLTGFATSKQKTIFDPSTIKHHKVNGDEYIRTAQQHQLWAQHSPEEGVMYLRSTDGNGTGVQAADAGAIVKISRDEFKLWQADISNLPDTSTPGISSNKNNSPHPSSTLSSSNWIPLEGLYGIYILPSGTLWVLITGSESVYSAPSPMDHSEWFHIRRVTDMELVHVPSRILSIPQLKEEVRQVQLLRKALKKHDFYFVAPPSTKISETPSTIHVPDMTKNLQRSFLVSMKKAYQKQKTNPMSSTEGDMPVEISETSDCTSSNAGSDLSEEEEITSTGSEKEPETYDKDSLSLDQSILSLNDDDVPWWENSEGENAPRATANPSMSHLFDEDDSRPDSRFFWNEASVEPLIQRYHTERSLTGQAMLAHKMLLQHVIPLTSAFVGIQRNVTIQTPTTGDDDGGNGMPAALCYDQLLISRRSRFRAGTRFTKRGADATGAVANYAETEQVCFLVKDTPIGKKKKLKPRLVEMSSHIQTRGSIPLRWSSPTDIKTYRPRVRIGMDPVAQTRALLAHVVEQLALYSSWPNKAESNNQVTAALDSALPPLTSPKLVFINLIDKKSDQGRLGRAFDAVLKAVMEVYAPQNTTDVDVTNATTMNALLSDLDSADSSSSAISSTSSLGASVFSSTSEAWYDVTEGQQAITLEPNSVKHIWYDFHAEVKHGRWNRLGRLLKRVKPSLLDHGYFSAVAPSQSTPEWTFTNRQRAVIRTNCMDCLDRTNVVQSIFGRFMLFQQLQNTGSIDKDNKGLPAPYVLEFDTNPLALPWTRGEVSHRSLWADNADAISRLYAGTPALKRDFTRTGKRTKLGALDDGVNSLQRYYLNNFLDADRQEGTDLMVGYAEFANMDDCETAEEGEASGTNGLDYSGMTLQEAARQMLLGNNIFASNNGASDDDEKNYARIKRKSAPSEIGVGGALYPNQRPLDLRWLPGDLQDEMRSRASMLVASQTNQASVVALKEIDRRSASDEPWWVVPDSSDIDDDDKDGEVSDYRTAAADRGKRTNHPGFVLGSFLVGTRAPLPLAVTLVTVLGAMYFTADNTTTSSSEDTQESQEDP